MAMSFHSYAVNTAIRTAPASHLFQDFDNIAIVLVVHNVGLGLACHLQALWDAINSDNPLRAQHECAADRELSNWATSPYRNDISRTDAAILRRHVTGWKNVREK